jgi:hypothetical protein
MHQRGKAFTTALPTGHHALVFVQSGEQALDVIVATPTTINLVFQTQVYKLKREMQPPSRS